MLVACLAFGLSISSYSYRRQHVDIYQNAFFVVAICGACSLGAIWGSDVNLIMLGLIPAALCLAILLSAFSHWGMGQCGMKIGVQRCELEDDGEKQGILA